MVPPMNRWAIITASVSRTLSGTGGLPSDGSARLLKDMSKSDYADLQQLSADFWRWRAFHQPNASDDIPRIERPAVWEPDWSAPAIDAQKNDIEAFEER